VRNGHITNSEVQTILQEVLASDRNINYDFKSTMADEDGIALDYANATQTTEEYVQTIQSIIKNECSTFQLRAGPYSIWEAICLSAGLPCHAGRTLYELVCALTASYHPEIAAKLFHNVPEDKLQDFWNGSHQHSKISALGRSTQLLLRVTELLLDVYICMIIEQPTGTFRQENMACTTNVNDKRKEVCLLAGPDPRILIHTGMLRGIVKACKLCYEGRHRSSIMKPFMQLDESDPLIICHFDLVVTANLLIK
jgi:hypothetical protein